MKLLVNQIDFLTQIKQTSSLIATERMLQGLFILIAQEPHDHFYKKIEYLLNLHDKEQINAAVDGWFMEHFTELVLIRNPSPKTDCNHDLINGFYTQDNKPVQLWSCINCSLKFLPIVSSGHPSFKDKTKWG